MLPARAGPCVTGTNLVGLGIRVPLGTQFSDPCSSLKMRPFDRPLAKSPRPIESSSCQER